MALNNLPEAFKGIYQSLQKQYPNYQIGWDGEQFTFTPDAGYEVDKSVPTKADLEYVSDLNDFVKIENAEVQAQVTKANADAYALASNLLEQDKTAFQSYLNQAMQDEQALIESLALKKLELKNTMSMADMPEIEAQISTIQRNLTSIREEMSAAQNELVQSIKMQVDFEIRKFKASREANLQKELADIAAVKKTVVTNVIAESQKLANAEYARRQAELNKLQAGLEEAKKKDALDAEKKNRVELLLTNIKGRIHQGEKDAFNAESVKILNGQDNGTNRLVRYSMYNALLSLIDYTFIESYDPIPNVSIDEIQALMNDGDYSSYSECLSDYEANFLVFNSVPNTVKEFAALLSNEFNFDADNLTFEQVDNYFDESIEFWSWKIGSNDIKNNIASRQASFAEIRTEIEQKEKEYVAYLSYKSVIEAGAGFQYKTKTGNEFFVDLVNVSGMAAQVISYLDEYFNRFTVYTFGSAVENGKLREWESKQFLNINTLTQKMIDDYWGAQFNSKPYSNTTVTTFYIHPFSQSSIEKILTSLKESIDVDQWEAVFFYLLNYVIPEKASNFGAILSDEYKDSILSEVSSLVNNVVSNSNLDFLDISMLFCLHPFLYKRVKSYLMSKANNNQPAIDHLMNRISHFRVLCSKGDRLYNSANNYNASSEIRSSAQNELNRDNYWMDANGKWLYLNPWAGSKYEKDFTPYQSLQIVLNPIKDSLTKAGKKIKAVPNVDDENFGNAVRLNLRKLEDNLVMLKKIRDAVGSTLSIPKYSYSTENFNKAEATQRIVRYALPFDLYNAFDNQVSTYEIFQKKIIFDWNRLNLLLHRMCFTMINGQYYYNLKDSLGREIDANTPRDYAVTGYKLEINESILDDLNYFIDFFSKLSEPIIYPYEGNEYLVTNGSGPLRSSYYKYEIIYEFSSSMLGKLVKDGKIYTQTFDGLIPYSFDQNMSGFFKSLFKPFKSLYESVKKRVNDAINKMKNIKDFESGFQALVSVYTVITPVSSLTSEFALDQTAKMIRGIDPYLIPGELRPAFAAIEKFSAAGSQIVGGNVNRENLKQLLKASTMVGAFMYRYVSDVTQFLAHEAGKISIISKIDASTGGYLASMERIGGNFKDVSKGRKINYKVALFDVLKFAAAAYAGGAVMSQQKAIQVVTEQLPLGDKELMNRIIVAGYAITTGQVSTSDAIRQELDGELKEYILENTSKQGRVLAMIAYRVAGPMACTEKPFIERLVDITYEESESYIKMETNQEIQAFVNRNSEYIKAIESAINVYQEYTKFQEKGLEAYKQELIDKKDKIILEAQQLAEKERQKALEEAQRLQDELQKVADEQYIQDQIKKEQDKVVDRLEDQKQQVEEDIKKAQDEIIKAQEQEEIIKEKVSEASDKALDDISSEFDKAVERDYEQALSDEYDRFSDRIEKEWERFQEENVGENISEEWDRFSDRVKEEWERVEDRISEEYDRTTERDYGEKIDNEIDRVKDRVDAEIDRFLDGGWEKYKDQLLDYFLNKYGTPEPVAVDENDFWHWKLNLPQQSSKIPLMAYLALSSVLIGGVMLLTGDDKK